MLAPMPALAATRSPLGLLARARGADPVRVILLAPPIFAAHVAEEAPGFVSWFNARVTPDISAPLFFGVNGTALVITVAVALLAASSRDAAAALVALAWLSFLMLANGVFHVTATLVDARYCPGTVTGALLYLPFGIWFALLVRRRYGVAPWLIGLVALAGAAPMLAHCYLIVFRGSRLF